MFPDTRDSRPTIAISMGDPAGVGPEVLVKALADSNLRRTAKYRIHGLAPTLARAAAHANITPFWTSIPIGTQPPSDDEVTVLDYSDVIPSFDQLPTKPTQVGGEISFRFVEAAIADCQRSETDPLHAHAIVTAPISKEAWALAGHAEYPGHTELLAARFAAKRYAMMFVTPRLRVVLATAHVPLMRVAHALTTDRVFDAIDLGAAACRRLGISNPRIAVCGLNPHAGEAELLGHEDSQIIKPAIEHARRSGIDASGPHPGDTIFSAAVAGRYDLVVAMYHDQGLIPIKLLDFHAAVNVTLGLPTIRTSPDHGTAYDIAGRNLAEEGSMKHALQLAVTLSAKPRRMV